MKRSAGSDFDEEGVKWFQSPHYKEIKTDMATEDGSQVKDSSRRFTNDFEKDAKMKKELFYDMFTRTARNGDFKLNMDQISRILNVRIEEIPDNYKVTGIFEDLNSKSSVISRGKKNWSEQETSLCIWLVMAYCNLNNKNHTDLEDKDWESIGRIFPGKTAEQCKARWMGLLKTNLSKAPWTQEEDKLLMDIIQEKGPKKWKEIACELNKKLEAHGTFRQGKQCRERWINHLDPSINRGAWSQEEDIKLMEAHLQIGKKWADIAKALGNRTENAVKNRWNSLIKKYKSEFGMDFDTLSTSSAYSNKSMEDLEKKIAEMIVSTKKKKGFKQDSTSPNYSTSQILEVPEEESPGYGSDLSMETALTKTEESVKNSARRDEEDRNDSKANQKKGAAAAFAPKKKTTVNVAMNNLKEMVTEEMQNQTQTYQQAKPATVLDNLFAVNKNNKNSDSQAQRMFIYDNPANLMNGGSLQEQLLFSQAQNNAAAMPLLNAQNEQRNGMFNMTNDMIGLNMLRNSFNGLTMFNQNVQQPTMSPNLFNIYSPGNFLQQTNFNLSSASLPHSNEPIKVAPTYLAQMAEAENKLMKQNEPRPEEKESRSFKLVEKPIEQLNNVDPGQPNLYYAVVDLSGGSMYLLEQINKDNFPPSNIMLRQKPSIPTNSMPSSLDLIGNSPALMAQNSWTSPRLNTALLNYPNLFNNTFANFGFGKNQISSNMNYFQESPKVDNVTGFFGSTPKIDNKSNEWTPETVNRPIFSNLTMKQRVGLANSRGDTPPEIAFGTGAFLRRVNDKAKPTLTNQTEGLKYSSPSSFLQGSQTSYSGMNIMNSVLEKI